MKNAKLYLLGLLLIFTFNNIIAQDTTKVNGHLVIPNGSVGIGTKVPTNKLDIKAENNKSGLTLSGLKSTNDLSPVRTLGINNTGEVIPLSPTDVNATTFKVNGSSNLYYPVVITESEDTWKNGVSEIIISHANVHADSLWWGSTVARFKFHSNRWGHGSNFVEPLVYQLRPSNGGSVKYLVAGWKHSEINPDLIVWLRGNTTYSFKGNTLTPKVYDNIQNILPFKELVWTDTYINHTTKSTVDSYIEEVDTPMPFESVWKAKGNDIYTKVPRVGIGTSIPEALLHIGGNSKFGLNNGISLGGNTMVVNDYSANFYLENTKNGILHINARKAGVGFGDISLSEYDGGKVGIGTTTPTAKLDVNGTANFTNSILLSGGSGTNANKIGFNADANSYFIQGISNGIQYSPYSVGNFTFTSGGGYWNFSNGNVGIGITTPPSGYKLAVAGDVIAERIVVKLQSAWPDYVFTPSYKRSSLPEIEQYIKENNHLPNIPSAQEVADKGIDVGALNAKMMEKIEELTLYLIEQNKKIEALEKKNEFLERAIKNSK